MDHQLVRSTVNRFTGREERHHEPAKKDAGLIDGYCRRCNKKVTVFAIEYPHDHPEHFDGTSEFRCARCGLREGRWTGATLTGGASEPRKGEERSETIAAEQARFPVGSQPR